MNDRDLWTLVAMTDRARIHPDEAAATRLVNVATNIAATDDGQRLLSQPVGAGGTELLPCTLEHRLSWPGQLAAALVGLSVGYLLGRGTL